MPYILRKKGFTGGKQFVELLSRLQQRGVQQGFNGCRLQQRGGATANKASAAWRCNKEKAAFLDFVLWHTSRSYFIDRNYDKLVKKWFCPFAEPRNKRDFFVFLCFGTSTSFVSAVVAVQRIWRSVPALQAEETWIHHVVVEHPGIVAFLVMDTLIFFAAATLLAVQASQGWQFGSYGRTELKPARLTEVKPMSLVRQDPHPVPAQTCDGISRNITTNEYANAFRYGYLRGPDGQFRNPYNHGYRRNCADFLIHGYTDDNEIAWLPLQQVAR
ncbi:unnamed protein product [Ilex paraguariensis]|uniref:Uncharacterized protein n=1 Tax=Ilex paraguariensis TaxID=185542 RepID=A0ABC8RLF4_9AQUA